jgi:hypothetical protein
MISVGGYRFMIEQVQELIKSMDAEGRVAVLPDAFAGYRLVGSAAHVQAVQDALAQQGVNPLIAAAFRERTPAPESRTSLP